jgi:hypothetical protein
MLLSFESAMALFINLYLIFVIEVAASLEYFDSEACSAAIKSEYVAAATDKSFYLPLFLSAKSKYTFPFKEKSALFQSLMLLTFKDSAPCKIVAASLLSFFKAFSAAFISFF